MKTFRKLISIIIIGLSFATNAQEHKASDKKIAEKKSYYQQRAIEDAKYEQQFSAETKAEEEAFWKEQDDYEKNLKQNDKKAYRAYMKEKKDAYAKHYEHCNHHYCHHSDYYYHHASFYYYGYSGYYSERYPRRSTASTKVSIGTPSVRLGLF